MMFSRFFKITFLAVLSPSAKAFCPKPNINRNMNTYDSSQTRHSMVSIDALDFISPVAYPFKNILGFTFKNSLANINNLIPGFETTLENQAIESNMFAIMSHIGLDFGSYLSDKTEAIQLIILIGRLSSLISDYLPDHHIQPDDLIIQLYMLYFSSRLLIRSCTSMISTLQNSLSFEELRLYSKIFKPAGVSILQYRVLASKCFEWKEVPPYSILSFEDEDDISCMLYQGKIDINVQVDQYPLHRRCSDRSMSNIQSIDAFGFFDDLVFAQRICSTNPLDDSMDTSIDNEQRQSSEYYPQTNKITAGEDGALLLKINTTEMLKLVVTDDRFLNAIKSISFARMHGKLSNRLELVQ